jgi:hypothetical protein
MAECNNLLIRLHRWVNRQDENFTTEAFVHLLQHLLDHEPQVAVAFLKFLTGNAVDLRVEEVLSVHLETQVTTDSGRPDVAIQTSRHRGFLEAKVEAGVGKDQLEKYRGELDKCGFERAALILLTRYPVPPEALGGKPDKCVRWYEIADWLAGDPATSTIQHAVSRHTARQFLGFLSARGMTMEQVGWEMVSGVQALRNFLSMLAEAASACKVSVKPNNSANYTGFFLADSRYWLGLAYETPGILHIHTAYVRIDKDKAEKLGKGELCEENWVPGKWAWQVDLDLQAEEVHFFARSRASQMQCLERFILEFLEAAKTIEAPDQTAPAASELDDDVPPFADEVKG